MARDLTMAFAFGDHPSVAAFMVAFRLSNLFRRLLGEGPLQSAFIPHFEGLRIEDAPKASLFFCKLTALITVLLLSITLLAEASLSILPSLFTLSPGTQEIITLTGWLFPSILFICLYGLNISLLNCYDSFFIPSVAPFICNAFWITSAFLLRNEDPSLAMTTLSKWIVIGFMGQWLLTLPLTLKHVAVPWKEWFSIQIPPAVKQLAKSFSLGAIGVGAMQINAVVDALFARYADSRGPVYLWYSIRIEQLALALFGIACISTIVPRLSRAIKADNLAGAGELFSQSYQRIMTILIPATFAMIALGLPAINLLYGRGHFLESAVLSTSSCLSAYSFSLLPTTLIMLFSALYYAKGNFRLPMMLSCLAVLINSLLNYVFVFGLHLGVISIALATSFSTWVNALILFSLVRRQGWKTGLPLSRFFNIIFASSIALLAALASHLFLDPQLPQEFPAQVISLAVPAGAFLAGLLLYTIVFKPLGILSILRSKT